MSSDDPSYPRYPSRFHTPDHEERVRRLADSHSRDGRRGEEVARKVLAAEEELREKAWREYELSRGEER